MQVVPRDLIVFRTREGRVAFEDWLGFLKDKTAIARILARIDRIRLGNFGDCKPVGQGVSELRIDFGPGYRIYFGQDGPTLVVLLCGGAKRTQARDIRLAKAYWNEFKEKR